MSEAVSAYWWIVIPLVLAFILLIFSLERRSSKDKKTFPQNYVDGLKAIISGDDDGAFVKLKQAVADDTDNIDAYLKLGDLFRKRGHLEKAIQVHRELLIRKNIDQNTTSMIHQSLANDYIQAKRFEQALEILEKLVKDASFKIWAQERMLEVYEKTKQWEKAFSARKNLLHSKDQYHKLAVYRHLNGNVLFNEGEFHKARLAYKEALKYDSKFAPAYIMIAESYLAENRNDDAADFYKKLAANVPSELYQATRKMEQTFFELGRFSDVETTYREILENCPDDLNILKALAGIEEKKGNIPAAIETLTPALNAEAKEAVAVTRLAELYLNNNQQEKAIEVLETIQEKWPSLKQQYKCPHCGNISAKQEIVCPNCMRVGPYKRL